jgi:hypothetical protein
MNDILEFVPESEVRDGIKFARGMLDDSTLEEAVGVLGNGERVSGKDQCRLPVVRGPASEEL